MPNISDATKVTLTIVVSILVAYLGYRLMEDLPLFSSSRVIYTNYAKVDGLTTGSYIYISGVKVGSVKGIKLTNRDSVRVSLTFNTGVKITKGSVAKLESTGLLGDKAIYIDKANGSEQVKSGGTIPGNYSGGMLSSIKQKGSQLTEDASQSFSKLNQTLTRLQKLVNEENRQNIDQTLAGFKQTSQQLASLMKQKRAELESTIDHANQLMANLDTVTTDNKQHIDRTFASLDSTMTNMKQASAGLKSTSNKLNAILTKIDDGSGSLGKMVNDPSLYNHLDSLSTRMGKLIKNINKDPGKYLKGLRLIDIF